MASNGWKHIVFAGAVATSLVGWSTSYAQESAPKKPTSSEEQLLGHADQIAAQVGSIRGLELKEAFAKGVKDRDSLRAVLLEKLSEEVTDADIENESKVFKRLGLFSPEIDYKKMMVDLLTEQIAGFYDQKSKELYIMEGIPLELQRPAMAHEIFHAIQDQHFDIGAMLAPFSARENGDFALARMALIEGDATVVMIDFSLYEANVFPQEGVNSIVDIPMLAAMIMELDFDNIAALEQMIPTADTSMGESSAPPSLAETALASSPAIIRELLMFPYFGGMRFVIIARSGRSWADVNAIYENPPVSTEQIMHPERYFAGDEPTLLSFDPSAALSGYKPIYDTVLGELQILLWLKTHLGLALDDKGEPLVAIAEAAKGWGGDRLLGFEDSEGNVVVAHLSSWDTVEDAGQFFDAHVAVAAQRFPKAKSTTKQGPHGRSLCMQRDLGERAERIYIEQWGDMVLHIEGAPSRLDAQGSETDATTFMIRDRVWKTFRRTPFDTVYQQRLAKIAAEKSP